MLKLNKKGMSSIEILLAFVLTTIILVTMFNVVMGYKTKQQTESTSNEITTYINTITKTIQSDLISKGVTQVAISSNISAYTEIITANITFATGDVKKLVVTKIVNPEDKSIAARDEVFNIQYDGIDYKVPEIGEYQLNGKKTYDLKINDIRITTENDVFDIYIGFLHPDLGTDYAIKIMCPMNLRGQNLIVPILRARDTATSQEKFYRYAAQIKTVIFQDEINIPGSIPDDHKWDVSQDQNGSVMAYLTDSDQTLYIQANSQIYLNENSSYLFSGFSNLINFNQTELANATLVQKMNYFFYGDIAISAININTWETPKVTDMSYLFGNCYLLKSIQINKFNTSNVTSMRGMFNNVNQASSFNLNMFDTKNVADMAYMFAGCGYITQITLPTSFKLDSVTNTSYMFQYCRKLTLINTLSTFNTSNVVNMSYMFHECDALTSLDLTNWNTAKVVNMTAVFSGCNNLTSLNVSTWNTSSAITMAEMFFDCEKLTSLNVKSFNTANVTNMYQMFKQCRKLTSIDCSSFNTANVTNMKGMFWWCQSITGLNISSFNTSKVTTMDGMFAGCDKMASFDLRHFDTSNVENMNGMFGTCISATTIDLSSFNTAKVKDMNYMFDSCMALTQVKVKSGKWTTTSATTIDMWRNITNKLVYV